MENIIFAEISEELLADKTLQDQFIDQIKELAKNKWCAILLPSKRSYEYWLNNNLDPVSKQYDLILDMAVEIEYRIHGAIGFMGNVIDANSLKSGVNIALWEYLDEESRLPYDCAFVFLPKKLTKNLHKNIRQYRYANLNETGFDLWNHQDLLGFELNNGGYWFKNFKSLIQSEKIESVAKMKKFIHDLLYSGSQNLLEYKELPKGVSSKEPCAFCKELIVQQEEVQRLDHIGNEPQSEMNSLQRPQKAKIFIKNKSRKERGKVRAKLLAS